MSALNELKEAQQSLEGRISDIDRLLTVETRLA